jgi:Viral coat protein P2 N-terminal domain
MGALQRANNISKVQAGAPCIVKFDLGNTLDKIKIKLLGGLTPAMITKVQLRTDGRMVYESTGLRMLMQFAYKNITIAPNEIVLNFTELDARNGATEQLMASIPTNLLRDLSLELEIASTAPATADIKVQNLVRGRTANPYIAKQFKHSFDINAIGQNSLFIPTGALGAIIKRIYIHEAATDQITDIELSVDNVRMMETTRADYEVEQRYNRLVPQNKLLVLDFVQDGNMNGAISTLPRKDGSQLNVELRLTAQSLGLVDCYFEIVDHINRR